MECVIDIPTNNKTTTTDKDGTISNEKKSVNPSIFSRIYRICINKSDYWNYKTNDIECGNNVNK